MLIVKGAGALDWNFFTRSAVPVGESGGGFAHAIVGTMILVGLACAIGIPVGVAAGIYLAEFGGGTFGWIVRFVADTLNGIPSIVIGIFAWTWIVRPAGKFTAFAGRDGAGMHPGTDRGTDHRRDGAPGPQFAARGPPSPSATSAGAPR